MSARVIRGGKSGIEAEKRGLGQFYFESAQKHGDKICQVTHLIILLRSKILDINNNTNY